MSWENITPPKDFKKGATVRINDGHPWAGEMGQVVRHELVKTMGVEKPVALLNNGTEVFIISDNQADIVRFGRE